MRRKGSRIVRALIAAAVALLVAVPTANATLPGPNGKIAFQSDRAGTWDVWTMGADGSAQTQILADDDLLFPSELHALYPAWSPDGRDIAFAFDSVSSTEAHWLMTMDANGADQFHLTPSSNNPITHRTRPTWSPDTKRIAYEFQGPIASADLSGLSDGFEEVLVTEPPEGAEDHAPDWSPNGQLIAFHRCLCASTASSSTGIWVADATGGNEAQLTSGPFHDEEPNISPDGQKVLFQRRAGGAGGGSYDLYLVPIAGGAPVQITNTPLVSEEHAVWSPDGTKIAFSATDSGNEDVYVMNADGTASLRITTAPQRDSEPSWQRVAVPAFPLGRPKGASPSVISLVPAYASCTAPNRTHGPPLGFDSCSPPAQASAYATVGTADSNGWSTRSVGSVLLDAIVGDPATRADEADMKLRWSITDVRRADDPSIAYPFNLLPSMQIKITDKRFGCCDEPGTIAGTFDLFTEVPCAPAGPSLGSTCSLETTADTLIPGAIREGKRSIWELAAPLRLYDAGEDGSAGSTDDNTLFATQGLFVP